MEHPDPSPTQRQESLHPSSSHTDLDSANALGSGSVEVLDHHRRRWLHTPLVVVPHGNRHHEQGVLVRRLQPDACPRPEQERPQVQRPLTPVRRYELQVGLRLQGGARPNAIVVG